MNFKSCWYSALSVGLLRVSTLTAWGQQPVLTAGVPALFAPGVVSTPYTEWSTSFTPDGNTVYFSQGAIYWTIVFAKKVAGQWTTPQVAPFSGQWTDTDPFVSPDGKRLFFISNRPLPDSSQVRPQKTYAIWYVDQLARGGWGAPQPVGAPVNMAGISNFAPSVSREGTLYFSSRNREGHAGMSSYSARWTGQRYETPAYLALNGQQEVQDPFIAPDEKYVVFVSGNDLYISYRQGTGWSPARKLEAAVNNGDSNSSPYISPDGQRLYYSSARIQGLYKRNPTGPALDYQALTKELNSPFNSFPNILVIPITIPRT